MISARVQANAFILQTKPYPQNFQEKLQSKTITQVADTEGLSTNHYFSVVASMIDASSENRNDFVLSSSIGRRANRASERKFSRRYEGRYRAPKSYWAPKPYRGRCR